MHPQPPPAYLGTKAHLGYADSRDHMAVHLASGEQRTVSRTTMVVDKVNLVCCV
jgi:hypothetical protein